jgi:hypothetical protein
VVGSGRVKGHAGFWKDFGFSWSKTEVTRDCADADE